MRRKESAVQVVSNPAGMASDQWNEAVRLQTAIRDQTYRDGLSMEQAFRFLHEWFRAKGLPLPLSNYIQRRCDEETAERQRAGEARREEERRQVNGESRSRKINA
jgi:hypothetical protein